LKFESTYIVKDFWVQKVPNSWFWYNPKGINYLGLSDPKALTWLNQLSDAISKDKNYSI
jgi:hypothetical protein